MKQMLRNVLRKIFYQKYYNWWDSLHRNLLNDSDVKLTETEKSEVDRSKPFGARNTLRAIMYWPDIRRSY